MSFPFDFFPFRGCGLRSRLRLLLAPVALALAAGGGGGGGGTESDGERCWTGGRREDEMETRRRDAEGAEEGATLEGVETWEWAGPAGGAEQEGVDW